MPLACAGCFSSAGCAGSGTFFAGFEEHPHKASGTSISAISAGLQYGLEYFSLMLCFTDKLVGLNGPGVTQCGHYKGKMWIPDFMLWPHL